MTILVKLGHLGSFGFGHQFGAYVHRERKVLLKCKTKLAKGVLDLQGGFSYFLIPTVDQFTYQSDLPHHIIPQG